jgi:uncharacterized LabA/DUF88 family protein
MAKKRIVAYYDGSNFYHSCNNNYGIANVNFFDMTNQLLDLTKEELIKIKYFNCPINQQEDPIKYGQQMRFFQKIKATPLLELYLGNLVKRNLKKINVNCLKCGHQRAEHLKCPICKQEINVTNCYKYTEKGVDVKLAVHLILDALNDKYDAALLFSNDADYCPAIKHIVTIIGKEIIYCHFPTSKTNDLIQTCSNKRLITKEMVERANMY